MSEDLGSILIADDDHLMLFGLSRALRQKGLEVTTAATAGQAILSLDHRRYDLCLLSYHLPDASGPELLEAIRSRLPETVFILMTASFISDLTVRGNVKEALASGNCLFLTKPFHLSEATDLVIRALAGDLEIREAMRLTDDGYLDWKRNQHRKPYVRVLNITTSFIEEGEVRRGQWRAVSTDLCEDGIGVLTQIPLRTNQVISFDQEFSGRSGIVIWSTMLDNQFCRAGVKFI
jgi:CheY-like chemotaxis protein